MSELLDNPVFSSFAEKIIDFLFKEFSKFIRDHKEEAQLKHKLGENLKCYFKEGYQSLTISEDFDVHGLHDYLIENLYTKVALCFIAGSSKESSYYRDILIESSYKIARASKKEKQQGVYAYVYSFLEVIKNYFLSKVKPEDLFLVNQQTDEIKEALADYIQTQNEKLQAFIEYHGSFAEYIDSIKLEPLKSDSIKNPLDRNLLFHYLNPEIGFVRRDAQFNFLDGFLEHDADLLCLAITGDGGIGKSKLLYQYIRELRYNLEWKSVILDRFSVDRLREYDEWKYPKNLLIVIDYAAAKSKIIGEWIRSIQQSHSCPHKMRIILLERQGVTKVNKQTFYPSWYQKINEESGNYLERIQYPYGNGFCELHRFNKEELFQVMEMHPEVNSKLTETVKEKIYNKIISFSRGYQDERFNTPLFALLWVDAYIYDKDIPDPGQLMSYVIKRNEKSWERSLAAYKDKKDLVKALERSMVYATATGGCDLIMLPSPLAADMELLINSLKMDGMNQLPALIAGDSQQHHQLEPLKPDIVGEYFVLHYINQNRFSEKCKKMIEACWKKPEEFMFFLIRCVRSYLGEFQDLVFEEQPILFQGADPYDQSLVLFGMTMLPEITLCQNALEHIKRLYQEHEETKLAEIFAMGLANLSARQEDVEALQATVDKLKALSERWPENPEIALRYAMGLVNLSFIQEEVEALQATVDKLKALSEQWPENPEIALRYAMGLANLSARQEDVESRQATVDKLKTLSEQWPENPEIAHMYAMCLVNPFRQTRGG